VHSTWPPQPSEPIVLHGPYGSVVQGCGVHPHMLLTPPPPQVFQPEHEPQLMVPPQPSDRFPQFFPCAAQVVGTHTHEPERQLSFPEQVPQSSVPPQPSSGVPHPTPRSSQLAGTHGSIASAAFPSAASAAFASAASGSGHVEPSPGPTPASLDASGSALPPRSSDSSLSEVNEHPVSAPSIAIGTMARRRTRLTTGATDTRLHGPSSIRHQAAWQSWQSGHPSSAAAAPRGRAGGTHARRGLVECQLRGPGGRSGADTRPVPDSRNLRACRSFSPARQLCRPRSVGPQHESSDLGRQGAWN
jgi:hypothetical protein